MLGHVTLLSTIRFSTVIDDATVGIAPEMLGSVLHPV